MILTVEHKYVYIALKFMSSIIILKRHKKEKKIRNLNSK